MSICDTGMNWWDINKHRQFCFLYSDCTDARVNKQPYTLPQSPVKDLVMWFLSVVFADLKKYISSVLPRWRFFLKDGKDLSLNNNLISKNLFIYKTWNSRREVLCLLTFATQLLHINHIKTVKKKNLPLCSTKTITLRSLRTTWASVNNTIFNISITTIHLTVCHTSGVFSPSWSSAVSTAPV